MTDKTGLARITHLGIGSAVAILLIVGASFYRSITVSREGDRRVAHTHEALENLEGLLSAMQDVDASCLTFVLMGDEQDLASYHSGVLRTSEKAKPSEN
jgi:CHASE3 domain sensor protein